MNSVRAESARAASSAPAGTLTGQELHNLAPCHLPTHRHSRYTAEDERQRLHDFVEPDQKLLRSIYQSMLDLFLALKPVYTDEARARDVIAAFIQSGESHQLTSQVEQLGKATLAAGKHPHIGRLIHDLRGGAFQALAFRLELLGQDPKSHGVRNVFFLTRDHLKIMRNGVQDLDVPRFEADRCAQNHDAQLIVEKWSQAEFHAGRKPVKVVLNCDYLGTLCESCLEFSTLDRIIYNLMNNAAEHSSDGTVHFFVLPVPRNPPENVRFVFCNAVDAENDRLLHQEFGDDLGEIFRGGFTTHGHGVGMRICADFCAQAFGLPDFEKAKAQGYFGAKWIQNQFTAWFHWPIVHAV